MSNGERMRAMITNAKDFGQALRKRRQELGYTQAYVSACSGFSVSFISDLENGKNTAELGKAIVLANLLGMDCSLTPRG
jgi:transcriptional regulator with XRE-family HTH domain